MNTEEKEGKSLNQDKQRQTIARQQATVDHEGKPKSNHRQKRT